MKILTIDIETSPNLAHVWQLFKANVSLSQLRETSEVISVGAKWHGDPQVHFYSTFHSGKQNMLEATHKLLSEADIVVHYNGSRFDIPHLNREFIIAGMHRPAPFNEVDLLKIVKRNFRFVSNKLDHVAQELGLGSKTTHAGHALWVGCLNNDPESWSKMREYNMHDVELTESLFDRLRPWINVMPHVDLYATEALTGVPSCPCGSVLLQRRGFRYTKLGRYQRYQCQDCGLWSSSGKSDARVDTRAM